MVNPAAIKIVIVSQSRSLGIDFESAGKLP
jgi:predicted Ser/Thr protein kinase